MKLHYLENRENMRQIIVVSTAFFLALFLPHWFLSGMDSYTTKLRVNNEWIDDGYYLGLICAALAVLSFQLAMIRARIDRSTLKQHIIALERNGWFRALIVGLVVIMFLLLAQGIGLKQSSSPLNFIIRLLPREMALVVATIAVIATRKPFWMVLLALNVLYWVLVGSKAALFLVALAAVFMHIFEGHRFRPIYILYGILLAILLPLSFVMISGLRLGIAPIEVLGMLLDNSQSREVFFNRILTRVSWFDGMLLTPNDAYPLFHYNAFNFLSDALIRLVPGAGGEGLPFGQQIIYLFRAKDLDEFSGAIGMPGVFKVMYYNHGIFGLFSMIGLLFGYFYIVSRMTASRKPLISMVGFSIFIVGVSGMMISGNIDSALGKSIPILFVGLTIAFVMRLLFRSAAMRPVPA